MRLTLQTDYSLRVLMLLGVTGDRLVTIKEISETYDISKNHLMKVVHHLSVLGYLDTVRGKNGGMRLGREPSEVGIGALVRQTEPDMALVQCFPGGTKGGCRLETGCQLNGVLGEALAAFLAVLDKYTLADLLAQPALLSGLLGVSVAGHAA
ncbi:MAG: Rrf2 family transcriptional regulator [Kordiimonadales bacterium]|nr:MAG: Rrf2 family transcriptional regulator [Kordiimonadales bacterium]